MQIGQKKTTGQKMKKERNRGRETDRKPNISQIKKTGEHCIYAKRCGGCDYQGILYSQQLSKKQSYMRKLMEPFGKINPIIGMDDPYHYRHKVQAAFSCNKRGHIVAGVYEKHSHDIVDVEQCQIEDAQADAIIREIAENGSCVIVGRAADYILKDYDNVVRIFIHAPQDYRIQRVMDVYGDTPKEARVNIERSDKARASYYEHISGTHWGDARNYELTVDSSDGVEKTAQFIVRYITGHTQTDSAV